MRQASGGGERGERVLVWGVFGGLSVVLGVDEEGHVLRTSGKGYTA